MSSSIRFLMCAPDHYDVDYVINPWMEGNIHKSSRDRAVEQWQKLFHVLKEQAVVDLVQPQPGVPDMVARINEERPPEIRLWDFVRMLVSVYHASTEMCLRYECKPRSMQEGWSSLSTSPK